MSINAKWKDEIVQYQEVIPRRAQYVIFKIRGLELGCLNLYAPNRVTERINFWAQLYDVLPSLENWCLAGD